MPRILCAGLIAADLVFEVDVFPKKGTKNRALNSQMITGGGAMNAASAIASLGGDVALAGAIGDDLFGHFLRQKMVDRGIDSSLVNTLSGVATSRSANLITLDGDRTITNHRADALGGADLTLPPDFAFDAALVDTRWPEAAALIVRKATQAGVPVVVDAEAPVKRALDALKGASHVVFSEQGLADFVGGQCAKALKQASAEIGGWCAVTRGALPVLCCVNDHVSEVPTYPTEALNTLGAGDVWHGTFALALAQGRTERDAVVWSNAAAALKVSRPLSAEYLPTADDVAARIEMQTR